MNKLDFNALENATVIEPPARPVLDVRRKTIITASMAHLIVGKGKGGAEFSQAGYSDLDRKVAGILADEEELRFETPAMRLGIEREPAAIDAIKTISEFYSGIVATCENQKFLIHSDGNLGATPDGVLYGIPVEVKCPGAVAHLKHLAIKTAADLKAIDAKYYWQVVAQAACLGAVTGYFASFNPAMREPSHRLHLVMLKVDETEIALILDRSKLAMEYINSAVARGYL